MSLQRLNRDDFTYSDSLSITIDGIILVMFSSSQCKICQGFSGQFQRLPAMVSGVKFGICVLDDADIIIAVKSKNTSTPIVSVPRFILYSGGSPVAEYTGSSTLNGIISFLQEVVPKIKNSFMQQPTQQRTRMQQPQQQQQQQHNRRHSISDEIVRIDPETGVKEYKTSYGRPYNIGTEKDFLEYENAYIQNQQQRR